PFHVIGAGEFPGDALDRNAGRLDMTFKRSISTGGQRVHPSRLDQGLVWSLARLVYPEQHAPGSCGSRLARECTRRFFAKSLDEKEIRCDLAMTGPAIPAQSTA